MDAPTDSLKTPSQPVNALPAHLEWESLMHELVHTLNNILGTISGNTELLQFSDLDDDGKELLQQIALASQRGIDLVARLRDNTTKVRVPTTTVDLNTLVREAVSRIPEAASVVTFSCEADPCQAEVAPGLCMEALVHILSNAIFAGETTGRRAVVVTTRLTERHAEIIVEDEGPGLPAGMEFRIFEPFFCGGNVGKRPGKGLTVARAIARRHGGNLRIRNRPEQGGVRAEFAVPRSEPPPPNPTIN